MERSKKIVFIPHCILNQNAKAVGREVSPGSVKDLVNMFSETGVGIVQMPCPQLEFNGGLHRKPKGKSAYDTKKYRDYCRKLSKLILQQIEKYLEKKYNVLCVLGVEFSPTCAVHQLENGSRNVPGKGIFFEEFEEEMRKKNFQIPIVGVNLNNLYNTTERIQSMLKYS